jgi:hypothetical protein
MNGHGVFKNSEGVIYDGGYKRNVQHGEGALYFPDGRIVRGQWAYGKQMLPTFDDCCDALKSPTSLRTNWHSFVTTDDSPQPSQASPVVNLPSET